MSVAPDLLLKPAPEIKAQGCCIKNCQRNRRSPEMRLPASPRFTLRSVTVVAHRCTAKAARESKDR
jgi:hypothetical protein